MHLQVLLEDPGPTRTFLPVAAVGDGRAAADERPVDRNRLVDLLVADLGNPSSIIGALAAARENARRARETISTELWEALNSAWTAMPAVRARRTTCTTFSRGCASAPRWSSGVADATMSHDDGWQVHRARAAASNAPT